MPLSYVEYFLILTWRTPLSISFRAGVVVINSLNVFLSDMPYFSFTFLFFEKEGASEWGTQRENPRRGREREKWAHPSGPRAHLKQGLSLPDIGLKLTNCEIMTWAKVKCLMNEPPRHPLLLSKDSLLYIELLVVCFYLSALEICHSTSFWVLRFSLRSKMIMWLRGPCIWQITFLLLPSRCFPCLCLSFFASLWCVYLVYFVFIQLGVCWAPWIIQSCL